jgi:hypothetical protein
MGANAIIIRHARSCVLVLSLKRRTECLSLSGARPTSALFPLSQVNIVSKMEGESFNILAFGDESPQVYQYLLGVQRQRGRNVAIDLLFDQTFTVLQQELRRQSPLTKEQESLLKYRSIPDLAEGLQQRDIRNSALEDALLSIAQITGCMRFDFVPEQSLIRPCY